MIKLKDLLEQKKVVKLQEQSEELNLGPIPLAAVYGNNRVQVANNNWQRGAQQLVDQINNAVADRFQLNNLQITVTGIASTLAATTRFSTTGTGNSTNPPNHNYQTVGTSTGGNLPQAWSANTGGVRVTNGNQFLANTRAQLIGRELDQFLRSNLAKDAVAQLPQNYIVTRGVVQGNQPSMTAQITSKLTKKPIPDTPEYVIMYPFFQIGNTKNLVFVDHNSNKSQSQPTDGMRARQIQAAASDANVLFNGFQTYGAGIGRSASRGVRTGAFIKLDNAYKYAGSYAYYKDYDSWLADVQKLNKYVQAARQGDAIKDLRDGPDSKGIFLRGARGYYDPTGKSKYMGLAKFGFGSRNYFSFRDGKPFYLFKPKGDKAKVVADLFAPRSGPGANFDISATPTIMSNGKPSLLPGGKNSPMSKGPNEIPFFGSEILRTAASYQS